MIKNYLLLRYLNTDVNTFTSDIGLKLRKMIAKPLKSILKIVTKEKIHLISYPQLDIDTPYIFVSNHSFSNDIIAALATIDRSVYLLMGSTNQIEYNKLFYAAWVNGFIYVNRLDKNSRADAIPKMERVISSGTSVLLFPEGGHNNTENLLCNKLFSGVFYLARNTKAKVVPIAQYYEFGSKDIYIRVGNPINMEDYNSRNEAISDLRDIIATMVWDNLVDFSTPIKRQDLDENLHIKFMEQRRQEYLKNRWTRDVWEEELTRYLCASERESAELINSFEKVNVNAKNIRMIIPYILLLEEKHKYDFLEYMHKYWDK